MSRLFSTPSGANPNFHAGIPDDAPRSYRSLFDQKKWWKGADGWIRVKDMTQGHRANAAALLVRNAEKYATAVNNSEFLMLARWVVGGQGVPDEVLDSMDREEDERSDNPEEWIKSTPLYRSLTRRRKGDRA